MAVNLRNGERWACTERGRLSEPGQPSVFKVGDKGLADNGLKAPGECITGATYNLGPSA